MTERGDCHTVQGPWKTPTVEGLHPGTWLLLGADVDLGVNAGYCQGERPPPWHLWARLLLAQTSRGAVGQEAHLRARVVSVNCQAHSS